MRISEEEGSGGEEDAIQYPYATGVAPRKVKRSIDGQEFWEQRCKSVVKSETMEIKEFDSVYVEGVGGTRLIGVVFELYKCSNTLSGDNSSFQACISWLYQWADVDKKCHKKYYKCNEKFGDEPLPDGYREVIFSAHQDRIDILTIIRPVVVWFVNFANGKFKLPEVTYIMGDSIKSEPAKGMICCRFFDTINSTLFPLEDIRKDEKAKVFEDFLIPQVRALMLQTEKWLRELKARDKRLRIMHEKGLHMKKAPIVQTRVKRPRDDGGKHGGKTKSSGLEEVVPASNPAPAPSLAPATSPVATPAPTPTTSAPSAPDVAVSQAPLQASLQKPDQDLKSEEKGGKVEDGSAAPSMGDESASVHSFKHGAEMVRPPQAQRDDSSDDDSESSMSLG